MTESELLERIDRHIAQADKHMARGNEHMARGNELMIEVKAELAQSREERRDLRHFIRDITRRNEIVMRELVQEVRDLRAETATGHKVLLDLHEESLAQRQAIWTMIDELRRHGLGGRG